jgi:hypothetical protein
LTFSIGRNLRSEEPWRAVGALGLSLFTRDFAIGQITWDVTSQSLILVSRRSSRDVLAQSVQRWDTGWTIGVLGFDCRRGLGIFLFTTPSRMALVPT